jgi:hypothetical protein
MLSAIAAVFASITESASAGCALETTIAAGLMIPDFVFAISATVFPRRSAWSI